MLKINKCMFQTFHRRNTYSKTGQTIFDTTPYSNQIRALK